MQAVINRLTQFGSQPRVYILPTKFGYFLALILFVMLLGAINYSNSMAHLLVFLIASLCHIAMLYTHKNIAKLELKYASALPIFLGETAHFNVVISNPIASASYQVNLATEPSSLNKSRWFSFFKFEHNSNIPTLPPNQTGSAVVTINPVSRGYHALGKLQLNSQFPLGLFTSWKQFTCTDTVLVYPRAIGEQSLPSSVGDGEHALSNSNLGQEDFAGFNTYRNGDPYHSIAWKPYAKDNVLRSKQFTSSLSKRCVIRWEDTDGDTETRLSQLCKWIVEADKQQLSYRLEMPNKIVDFDTGKQHLNTCLTALAVYEH